MFKKFLGFIIIILISIQVPFIVSLSTAQSAASRVNKLEKKVEDAQLPAAIAGGIFSLVKQEVPALEVLEFDKISSVLAKGEKSLEEAQVVLRDMNIAMYISLFFTLFLIIMLLGLTGASFFAFLGYSSLLSGATCLVVAVGTYFFFVVHFNETFNYFFNQANVPTLGGFIPFVPSIAKSFSKDFIKHSINAVIMRNLIAALASVLLGIFLVFLGSFIGKKRNPEN